ncbi:MAG: DNA (cytosine-5-)-methyltransferase [Candidatus Margulisiibacteriota bacterium]
MVEAVPQGGNWKHIPLHIPSKRLEQIRKSGGRTTLYGRLSWDKPSYTITTYFNRPGNGTYIHPDEDRVISAREAARLQSFPDSYIFYGSKTSFCKQIGNAVPPLLAYFIANIIKKRNKVSNVLDLFCGAGGLSKGFEWAGYNIVAANDCFNAACETYRNNHKDTILIEGDITNKDIKKSILQSIKNKNIDIIVGGPPCQGFSYAGKRLIDDPRNYLYKEFVNIVEQIKPKVILMENVEGILTSNGGKTYESIKKCFTQLGYKIHGKKMHAVRYGIPQKRKRVVIIGLLKGDPESCFPKELFIDESKYTTVQEAIGDLPPINKTRKQRIKNVSTYQRFIRGQITAEDYIKDLS